VSEDYPIALAAKLRMFDSTINSKRADAMAEYRRGYKFRSHLHYRKAE
jgi:hypothetical protein